VQKIRDAFGDTVEYRRVEVVGPRVSGELLAYGMLGLMLAIFAILIYLWFRFRVAVSRLGAMIAKRPRHRADHRLHVDSRRSISTSPASRRC